jgi:FixJ family two-component response regulator
VQDGLQTYVFDPDPASALAAMLPLQRAGYAVKSFASGAELLQVVPVLALGCVILDVRSANANGLGVLSQLEAIRTDLPIVVIGASGGDVSMAVQALKAGATDWLEFPYREEALLMAVASALADIRRAGEQHRDAEFARARIAGLSARERQVLEGLLAGGTNKTIGRDIGISPRTVEMHRRSVMRSVIDERQFQSKSER